VRVTIVAALFWSRRSEITDALIDLLLGLIHKINTHADRRIERELIADLRRVRGKDHILFQVAEVAVEHPDDTIRDVLYPVVDERTLETLFVKHERRIGSSTNESVRYCDRHTHHITEGCSQHYSARLPFVATTPLTGHMYTSHSVGTHQAALRPNDPLRHCTTLGTTDAETILRRFTSGGPKHPTY
jgi:hypothetical protein